MRFERIALRGLGPFQGDVELTLSSIPGTVVAICGENGAGKSTLLELLGASLYRTCATRGNLAALATRRDAFVEVDVVNGARHRIRHSVDGVTGKGESLVLGEDGAPVLGSTKVTEFAEWAKRHLPAERVLYTSVFAPQGSGGLLTMKAAERKAVILRMLGIEHLEALAERARERVRLVRRDKEVLAARIGDERARAESAARQAEGLDAARAAAAKAERDLAAARARLEEARRARQAWEEAMRTRTEIARRSEELGLALEAEQSRREDLAVRIANNRAVLADAETLRASAARLVAIDAEVLELRAARGHKDAEARAVGADEQAARAQGAAARARSGRAGQRAEAALARLADEGPVREAEAALGAKRAEVAAAEDEMRAIEGAIEELRKTTLHFAETRVNGLRAGLSEIAGGAAEPAGVASGALRRDDAAVSEVAAAPSRIEEARGKLRAAREALDRKRAELAALERLAARNGEMTAAREELTQARVEAERASTEEEAERTRGQSARCRAEALAEEIGAIDQALARLAEERPAVAPVAARAERLASADARLSELEPELAACERRLVVAKSALASLPVLTPLPEPAALGSLEEAAFGAERALRAQLSAVTLAEQALEQARASEARTEELARQEARLDEAHADWLRLADDLGPHGVQALEIDAAGPEISAMTNELLAEAFGPRFTVRLDTVRRSADGKKDLEVFDISVLDMERGREGAAEALSGGEKVIVGEALSLALTMVACRKSGAERPTLVRDESGAALSPANTRRYVAMLRRAASIAGADKVLLVSHSPEVQELVDARVVIEGGRIAVHAAA